MSAILGSKFFIVFIMVCFTGVAFSQTSHYLVTNDDHSHVGTAYNSATFYTMSPTGNLTETANVVTGGIGWDSVGYAITRILISKDFVGNCAYLAEYGNSGGVSRYAVTTISVDTLTVVGHFKGSATDTVPDSFSNMGLAMYGSYLYANFTGPQTIGTYQRLAGCKLKFLGDVSAQGLSGGPVQEMVARKNILVVSFGDGSIESFNTSSGMPVTNGDPQYSSDYLQNGGTPEGVDATSDGHYVIFGDGGGPPTARAEVVTAINVRLSPDETLLYLSEFSTGQVSANFFDKTTGVLAAGCESPVLNGYRSQWVGTYTLQTKNTSGTGGVVYVAEPDTDIGVVGLTASGGTCSIHEARFSPVYDHHTISMESIGVFPPRPF